MSPIPSFSGKLAEHNISLTRTSIRTLQINVGKFCNQACQHCHVEAGPKRTERMERETALRILKLLEKSPSITAVDITGGAPELNENFRYLVSSMRQQGLKVIDRCNLTVLFEAGQEDLANFLAENQVRIVASLPCYQKTNVEKQRGSGVFNKSITALQTLNGLGYGIDGSGLLLDLVYNPLGAFLPPEQKSLEASYRRELHELFGISFTSLFTITNMPIKRFLHQLERDGSFNEYMSLLVNSFNPTAVEHVMCRDLISVDWQGGLFDCDFNQMLELPIPSDQRSIWDIDSFEELQQAGITVRDHCYACTAGSGSSCGGSLV
jgi:radical SAM/Cys-rich protein